MKILIIDNYDSFTFNLYQYIGEILQSRTKNAFEKVSVLVYRNDEVSLDDIKKEAPDRIIISPGPGSPDQASYFGVCAETIVELGKTTPILGVCLGMQGIAHYMGGKVVRATLPMHGKTSTIIHDKKGVFREMPQGIEIMRYHSLMVDAHSIPDCLEITSVVLTENMDEHEDFKSLALKGCDIMGIRHKLYPIEGIQFHPESFATEGSKNMLENFIFQ